MRISHRYRFIFFSFPKTGSESVRKLLNPYTDIESVTFSKTTAENPFYSHISPLEVRDEFESRGWTFGEYFRFTCVRNPWSRLVSLYEMVRATSPDPGSFEKWLDTVETDGNGLGGNPAQKWRKYGCYTIDNYVNDVDDTPLVDEVLRLEQLATELPPVLARLGLPDVDAIEIEHINARTHKPYAEYYTGSSIDRVREMYAADIDRFGYAFGD